MPNWEFKARMFVAPRTTVPVWISVGGHRGPDFMQAIQWRPSHTTAFQPLFTTNQAVQRQ